MAGTKRIVDSTLRRLFERQGHRFDFFQLVDLIERVRSDALPVGQVGTARDEAIRFSHDPELVFHASDVKWVRPPSPHDDPPFTRIRTTFLGLFGVTSPLPTGMTEDVLESERSDTPGLREFYDIFHHRLIALFFRAWQRNRLHAGHRSDAKDAFTSRALMFVGVDPNVPEEANAIAKLTRLGLAPILARRSFTVASVKMLAARLLPGVPFDIECFVLRRTSLRQDQRVQLGVRNSTLATDMAIGASVADRSGRFRVKLGPLTQEQADALSPGGEQYPTLQAILDHASGGGVLEAEVEIITAAEYVPRFRLGPRSARLGKTTRLSVGETGPLASRYIAVP